MSEVRVPPQAVDIERGIIGSILSSYKESFQVFDLLVVDDFYSNENKRLYEVCFILHSEGAPVNSISVSKRENIKASDLDDYVYEALPGYDIEYYAQIVKEKAIRRRVILGSNDLQKKAYEEGNDTLILVEGLNSLSDSIESGSKVVHSLTPSQIFEREKNAPIQQSIHTGDRALDDGIFAESGQKKGHVSLLIGESGHGKSSYARYLSECYLRNDYSGLWIQLEDYDVNTAKHFQENVERQMDNLYICQDLYEIESIKRECRMINRDVGIDFIVFDYVQNIECEKKERINQVEYISQQITRMAKDLNTVCLVLSQVSINQGSRHGWGLEPVANDVRWSKQLKQDAHAITSIFRPSEIESLIEHGEVKDWKDARHPINSVWVKQCKSRYGQKEFRRHHLIHTPKGLKPYKSEMPF